MTVLGMKVERRGLSRMDRGELSALLEPVLWDAGLGIDDAIALIERTEKEKRGVTAEDLYRKLLMSYNWYRLVEVLGMEYLQRHVLRESVIERLFPESMKKRYLYVRTILLSE